MMKYDSFEIGEYVALYSPYHKPKFLGKVVSKYFMGFTQANVNGGWYYNTETMQGVSGDILIKI